MVYTPPPANAPSDATNVMGRRIAAWVIDLVVFLGVMLASFALLAEYVEVPAGQDAQDLCDRYSAEFPAEASGCLTVSTGDGGRIYLLSESDSGAQTVLSFAYFGFFVVMQGLLGASPGKLVTGVRVVNAMGERAGVGRSLGRTLLWIVDAAPYLLPLVGFITGLTTSGHRRVGDMAAGTYVVRAAAVGAPVMPTTAVPPIGQPAWGTPPPGAPPGPGGFGVPTTPADAPAPGRSPGPVPTWTETAGDPRPPATDPGVTTGADATPPPVDTPPWQAATSGPSDAPSWEPPTAPTGDAPAWEPPTAPTADAPSWEPPTTPATDEVTRDPSTAPTTDAPSWEAPTVPTADAPNWEPPSAPEQTPPPDAAPSPVDPEATTTWSTAPSEFPETTPGPDLAAEQSLTADPGLTPETVGGTDPAPADPSPQYAELPPPQWDTARNTYIQWDPNRNMWLQWDATGEHWKPIDT